MNKSELNIEIYYMSKNLPFFGVLPVKGKYYSLLEMNLIPGDFRYHHLYLLGVSDIDVPSTAYQAIIHSRLTVRARLS